MPLTDMKRKPPKKSGNKTDSPIVYESDGGYPWGLRIILEKEELAKLSLKGSDFKIGETITITCEVEVISLRESADKNNNERSVELQILKLGMGDRKEKKASKFAEYSRQKNAGPTE